MISRVGTYFTVPLLIFGIIFYFFFTSLRKKSLLNAFVCSFLITLKVNIFSCLFTSCIFSCMNFATFSF